jgi:4-hydroxybenzoate polyprenyltransferase
MCTIALRYSVIGYTCLFKNSRHKSFMKNYLRLLFCPSSAFAGTFGAALLAGKEPDLCLCIAGFLVTFAVYTLDRLRGSAEDAINNPERAEIFIGKEKLFMGLIAASFLAAILITALINVWKVPYLLTPIGAGLIYTAKICGHRLKDIPTAKNLVVGLSWAAPEAGLAGAGWSIFAFFFLWAFNNSVICDIRDIKGDRLNGVRTIPVMLGAERTRLALVILTSVMWLLLPLNVLSVIAILYGYMLIGMPFREGLVDDDWVLILSVSIALSQVLHI